MSSIPSLISFIKSSSELSEKNSFGGGTMLPGPKSLNYLKAGFDSPKIPGLCSLKGFRNLGGINCWKEPKTPNFSLLMSSSILRSKSDSFLSYLF